VKTRVEGAEALPLNVCVEYHRCEELEPNRGLAVTDHDEPLSTEIDVAVVVSVWVLLTPPLT
jgi:hypothetical protein